MRTLGGKTFGKVKFVKMAAAVTVAALSLRAAYTSTRGGEGRIILF